MKFLEAFCESSNHRTWLFVWLKGEAALFRSFGDVPVAKRSGQESANVLHQEHLWFHNLYESKELPKKRPARVLNCLSPAGCAKCLAGWATHEQIELARFHVEPRENLVGIKLRYIALKDGEILREPSGIAIQPNRVAEGVLLLNTGPNAEAPGLLKAKV
jgi:hypothetical protein